MNWKDKFIISWTKRNIISQYSDEMFNKYISSNKMLESSIEVLTIISNHGYQAYLVGGCVRDIILEDGIHDVDIATNMPINKIENLFKTHDIGSSKDFGIVVIEHNGYNFEIAQFRKEENYTDGRRPENVEIVQDFKSDAQRRDFTINSMAIDKDGNIVDFFGGKEDINNKIIKTVGDPNERFSEDYLRILRAIRFAIKLDFDLDEKTKQAIYENRNKLKSISSERIKEELFKTASYGGKKFANMIRLMDKLNILDIILPEISQMKSFKHNHFHPEGGVFEHTLAALESIDSKDPLTNFSILFHDVGKIETYTYDEESNMHRYFGHDKKGAELIEQIAKRLRLSNEEKEMLQFVALNHMKFHNILKIKPSQIEKLISSRFFDILMRASEADAKSRLHLFNQDEWNEIINKITEIKSKKGQYDKIKDIMNGKLIIAWVKEIGKEIKPGRYLGKIKELTSNWMINTDTYDQKSVKKYVLDLYNNFILTGRNSK